MLTGTLHRLLDNYAFWLCLVAGLKCWFVVLAGIASVLAMF
jgi:hypothetical protein